MKEISQFREAVKKHFSFLHEYGFSGPMENNHGPYDLFLEYFSDVVSILVCYGPSEFHAELGFWLNKDPKKNLVWGI